MPRRRFDRQERPSGPRYYCFLCRRSIDSTIQACPKHEPELHRKLSDLIKKRDSRGPADRTESKEGGKKAPAKGAADKSKDAAKGAADKSKDAAKGAADKGKEAAKKPAEEKPETKKTESESK
jgi:hypothetical protein